MADQESENKEVTSKPAAKKSVKKKRFLGKPQLIQNR